MNSPAECSQVLERIKRAYCVTNDNQLSARIGRAPSTIHNWAKTGNVPTSELVAAARETGVSLDWLMLGEGEAPDWLDDEGKPPTLSPQERMDAVVGATGGRPGVSIPLYDVEGAAGAGRCLAEEEVHAWFHLPAEAVKSMGLPADQTVGIKVRGDSMLPTLDDGDWVLVDLTQRDPGREGVFLVLVDDERRIKRMQRVAGGAWMLISDNARYQNEVIAPEEQQFVEVLGRCVMRLGQVL